MPSLEQSGRAPTIQIQQEFRRDPEMPDWLTKDYYQEPWMFPAVMISVLQVLCTTGAYFMALSLDMSALEIFTQELTWFFVAQPFACYTIILIGLSPYRGALKRILSLLKLVHYEWLRRQEHRLWYCCAGCLFLFYSPFMTFMGRMGLSVPVVLIIVTVFMYICAFFLKRLGQSFE